ncbi:DUF697 domain-containing protein [Aurantimonas aggregata]|uniref:DUF697 domain-containing protein n=2 Tax=Aurantimonas aggregata TaxID=2047720 RepID=A0A6L9MCG3_9HYPH|nr:DUF697 domain-containing protein [Aurantimonas aggregata]
MAFRTAAARLVIERHSNMAAFAGLIPLPLVDIAAISAIVDRMLRKLAHLHGRRLRPERSRRMATALLAGVAAPGIARLTATTLLGLVPAAQMLGMVVGSISAAVLVRIIGEAYLNSLSESRPARHAAASAAPA